MWFPLSEDLPVGCLSSNSELVDLLTDNLRKKMLQTGNSQLVAAGACNIILWTLYVRNCGKL